MRVLVTGAGGQLGTDVVLCLTARGFDVVACDLPQTDITDADAVAALFAAQQPDAVIHCAAYTAVDKAERERDLCTRVNVDGTRNIAAAAESAAAKMIYISTDYVYSGEGEEPFTEDAPAAPKNHYGRTKYAGELAAQACSRLFVVRTSWVFGLHGNNFVKTMLRLGQSRDVVSVVRDQIGSPTFTEDLAALLCDMITTEQYGTYNVSNEGFCSWHRFALTIQQMAGRKVCTIPIASCEYPCDAERPLNSRMSKQRLYDAGFAALPHWKDALARFMHEYLH